MNAGGLIKLNEPLGTGDGGDGIEGQASIDFCGDAAGDRVQNLAAEADQDAIHDLILCSVLELSNRGTHQWRIFGLLNGFENQGWIRGRITRLKLRQLMKITGVRDHGCELLERLQLIHDHPLMFCKRINKCRA